MERRSAPDRPASRLAEYRARRDFGRTPEPEAATGPAGDTLSFVIQKHDATRLHYDFRLELDGVLLSWAVPKGPSLDPADKRMAVRTEDHPLAYAGFEGRIPAGQYGAGDVIVWDKGAWVPLDDPHAGLQAGKLRFTLHGLKLQGDWELVRTRPRGKQEQWLLFKRRDEHARAHSDLDITLAQPDSVARRKPSKAAPPKDAGPPRAPLPATFSPQLAVLASTLPAHGHWVFETKFDGYRLLARIEHGDVRLVTRNGHDWTDRMPALAGSIAALGVEAAWLDGEIIVPDARGRSDFNALQNAFDGRRTQAIEYRLFDLPYFEGHDLRDTPLAARRQLLQRLLEARPQPGLAFSEALGDGGAAAAQRALAAACQAGLEGVIAKRIDAAYRSTRDASWLKLKCQSRQEFVVGGYTVRSDDAAAIGSLILGVHDEAGRLVHAGSVGTGWDRAAAGALLKRLRPLAVDTPPFAEGARAPGRWSRRGAGQEQWVRPRTVVEVAFGEWTPAGHIRHASFVGLRSDKPARAIVRERAQEPTGVNVTHPERVIDADSGATKIDLVHYYESIAPFMLPHLQGRPVALVRAPGGVGAATFFQKHAEMPGLKVLDPSLWPGHEALLEIDSADALLAAAQMNVIEFHTWNSRSKSLMKPDRMVFDLDPGEGVAWPQVQEGAQLVRAMLDELGLPSWLKTSGGKGLHVVVPIAPRRGFDEVKGFSQAIVQHLAATLPQRFVAKSGPKNRVGRIFVDYLRNGEGATTVAAFSARARPGLGVSMPVAWDELPQLRSGAHWTIRTARDHLSLRKADPWAAMAGAKPTLTAAMKALGWKPG